MSSMVNIGCLKSSDEMFDHMKLRLVKYCITSSLSHAKQ